MNDLADAVLELVILAFALGIAHLLDDNLLGILRSDAAEIHRRKRLGDKVAQIGRGVLLRASAIDICVASFSTLSTTIRRRFRRISPDFASISALISFSWP